MATKKLSLHKKPHGDDKGEWGRDFLSMQEKFSCSKSNHSLDKPPQRHGRVLVTGGFQDATGQGARWSHPLSLSHKRLDQVIFQIPSKLGYSLILRGASNKAFPEISTPPHDPMKHICDFQGTKRRLGCSTSFSAKLWNSCHNFPV